MSKIEPYFLDDSCTIPDYIKQMTKEELDAYIERLEEEDRRKKEQKRAAEASLMQTV